MQIGLRSMLEKKMATLIETMQLLEHTIAGVLRALKKLMTKCLKRSSMS